jgi:hypothetical protein
MPNPLNIEIYIPESKSKLYGQIIQRATNTGMYCPDTSVMTIPTLPDLFRVWNDFSFIVWNCQKWTGFSVSIAGAPILPYANDYYYILQELKYCVEYRAKLNDPNICASGGWGCRKLMTIRRLIGDVHHGSQPWYIFGKFTSPDTWKVDKLAIVDMLQTEAEMKQLYTCPYFDFKAIMQSVDRIPDYLTIDERFETIYRVDYDKWGKEYYLPVSIRHVEQSPGYFREIVDNKPQETDLPKKPHEDDLREIDRYLDDMLKRKKRPD